MEKSPVPFAMFEWRQLSPFAVVVSSGFLSLFGHKDKDMALQEIRENPFKDVHRDDIERLKDALYQLCTDDIDLDTVFRTRKMHVVHVFGRNVRCTDGTMVAILWYADETMRASDGGEVIRSAAFTHGGAENQRGRTSLEAISVKLPQKLAEFKEEGKKGIVAYFDLIGMKQFNRIYGYAYGDKLLDAVQSILEEFLGDDMCCYLGQGHFLGIAKDEDTRRLLENIIQECSLANEKKSLPVHIGVCQMTDEEDIDVAIDRAKTACDTLRGTYISGLRYFDNAILDLENNRGYILSHLDQALAEKWIHIAYHPIIRSANNCVCDEEALSRWVDPVRGLLSPITFIPVLEEARLIYKLDLYVVNQVLEDHKTKLARGLDLLPVSVNISRADFETCDIVEEVAKLVDESGLGRNLINIEITESAVSQDPENMNAQINRFREKGFQVWMDDFGSGYSSLDLLQNFDFDLIKFDMTFLRQFGKSEKSRIILSELMNMALKLGVDTVVEGVETAEHVRFLKSIGCDKMQGMFFTFPLSLDKMLAQIDSPEGLRAENPLESEYYNRVGTANLNGLPLSYNGSSQSLFSYMPMAILELKDDDVKVLRQNTAFSEFINAGENEEDLTAILAKDKSFIASLQAGKNTSSWINTEFVVKGNTVAHVMFCQLCKNPVTKAIAMIIVVLAGR